VQRQGVGPEGPVLEAVDETEIAEQVEQFEQFLRRQIVERRDRPHFSYVENSVGYGSLGETREESHQRPGLGKALSGEEVERQLPRARHHSGFRTRLSIVRG
jgi:hypothetical protein